MPVHRLADVAAGLMQAAQGKLKQHICTSCELKQQAWALGGTTPYGAERIIAALLCTAMTPHRGLLAQTREAAACLPDRRRRSRHHSNRGAGGRLCMQVMARRRIVRHLE